MASVFASRSWFMPSLEVAGRRYLELLRCLALPGSRQPPPPIPAAALGGCNHRYSGLSGQSAPPATAAPDSSSWSRSRTALSRTGRQVGWRCIVQLGTYPARKEEKTKLQIKSNVRPLLQHHAAHILISSALVVIPSSSLTVSSLYTYKTVESLFSSLHGQGT